MLPSFFLRFLSPMTILLALSAIFYTVMHFYASSALEESASLSAGLVEHVLALRMLMSGVFCMLLGYMGVKLTGHVWPAMVAHTLVVAVLLVVDLPLEQVLHDWDISLLILAAVASLTGVAGGLSLGILWLRMKFPSSSKSRHFRK